MAAAWVASGRMPDELDLPDIPDCAGELWRAFLALNASRGNTGFGPAPLAWRDLHDYAGCMGIAWTAWEAETLTEMDRAALVAAMAKD